ncbi:MAG: pentapeptide repeat-containing protein [Saprospiraceae bacterium]|nr:pentapeptide repeat-containing protein [Saprospiraceae bacterium]
MERNFDLFEILIKGVDEWNNWRIQNKKFDIDLSYKNLSGFNLKSINLNGANLKKSDLSETNLNGANLLNANLEGANLQKSILYKAILIDANLMNSNLKEANLMKANLKGAKLSNSILESAKLNDADMSDVDLRNSDLSNADLTDTILNGANLNNVTLHYAIMIRADISVADLTNADLRGANLAVARCIETNFEFSNIENACVYGISVWDIKTNGLKQKNLIITRDNEAVITVDNLEVAQFIYLMLNNEKIRDVIGTIAKKGVLILGRFTPERKKILDAIREKLRESDFVPMMFDFEKISSRDFTETIKILAGMSRFVIADISNPKAVRSNFKQLFLIIKYRSYP